MGCLAQVLAIAALATHFGQPIGWVLVILLIFDVVFTQAVASEVKAAGGTPTEISPTAIVCFIGQAAMVAVSVIAFAT